MMAPKLRSGSNVKAHGALRPSPLGRRARVREPGTVAKRGRPRKVRQDDKQNHVADATVSSGRFQLDQGKSDLDVTPTKGPSEAPTFFGIPSDYLEPQIRHEAPSFTDSPWSGVSHNNNPILGTMRPLGAVPSDTDRTRVGLTPVGSKVKVIPAKRGLEDHSVHQVIEPATPIVNFDEIATALMTLPVPDSSDVDVQQLRTALEDAMALAAEHKNIAVIRGLLRLWENCSEDRFVLSVLGSVVRNDAGQHEISAFQSLVRDAWADVRAQGRDQDSIAMNGTIRGTRLRSTSPTSSLSSVKSMDMEPFVPAGGSHLQGRKEKLAAKHTRGRKRQNQSVCENNTNSSRKRALEDNAELEDAMAAKRQRMQKSYPNIIAHESTLRSSLASQSTSVASSPPPEDTRMEDGDMFKAKAARGMRAASDEPPTDTDVSENYDYCHQCQGSGQLLCCDGCANSFHFSCLDPPLDPANPPAGNWYCPKCAMSEVMGRYMDKLNKCVRKDFSLPLKFRSYFLDARTGDKGAYEDAAPIPRYTGRSPRGSKLAQYNDEPLTRTHEYINGTEMPISCFTCKRSADGIRPTLSCDYCPLSFHLDCLDPPMAKPPYQIGNSDRARANWMCPNHSYHDMFWFTRDEDGNARFGRIRRPRNPRLIDVDVLPNDSECERLANETDQGILYRVSQRGLSEDFIERAKWENYQADIIKRYANEYFQYTKSKYDELLEQVSNFYSTARNPQALFANDAIVDVLNSRTDAEREAISNLVAFAQSTDSATKCDTGSIGLLIDQLKADPPAGLPKPIDEIESLRALQDLISHRMQRLNAQAIAADAPNCQHIQCTKQTLIRDTIMPP